MVGMLNLLAGNPVKVAKAGQPASGGKLSTAVAAAISTDEYTDVKVERADKQRGTIFEWMIAFEKLLSAEELEEWVACEDGNLAYPCASYFQEAIRHDEWNALTEKQQAFMKRKSSCVYFGLTRATGQERWKPSANEKARIAAVAHRAAREKKAAEDAELEEKRMQIIRETSQRRWISDLEKQNKMLEKEVADLARWKAEREKESVKTAPGGDAPALSWSSSAGSAMDTVVSAAKDTARAATTAVGAVATSVKAFADDKKHDIKRGVDQIKQKLVNVGSKWAMTQYWQSLQTSTKVGMVLGAVSVGCGIAYLVRKHYMTPRVVGPKNVCRHEAFEFRDVQAALRFGEAIVGPAMIMKSGLMAGLRQMQTLEGAATTFTAMMLGLDSAGLLELAKEQAANLYRMYQMTLQWDYTNYWKDGKEVTAAVDAVVEYTPTQCALAFQAVASAALYPEVKLVDRWSLCSLHDLTIVIKNDYKLGRADLSGFKDDITDAWAQKLAQNRVGRFVREYFGETAGMVVSSKYTRITVWTVVLARIAYALLRMESWSTGKQRRFRHYAKDVQGNYVRTRKQEKEAQWRSDQDYERVMKMCERYDVTLEDMERAARRAQDDGENVDNWRDEDQAERLQTVVAQAVLDVHHTDMKTMDAEIDRYYAWAEKQDEPPTAEERNEWFEQADERRRQRQWASEHDDREEDEVREAVAVGKTPLARHNARVGVLAVRAGNESDVKIPWKTCAVCSKPAGKSKAGKPQLLCTTCFVQALQLWKKQPNAKSAGAHGYHKVAQEYADVKRDLKAAEAKNKEAKTLAPTEDIKNCTAVCDITVYADEKCTQPKSQAIGFAAGDKLFMAQHTWEMAGGDTKSLVATVKFEGVPHLTLRYAWCINVGVAKSNDVWACALAKLEGQDGKPDQKAVGAITKLKLGDIASMGSNGLAGKYITGLLPRQMKTGMVSGASGNNSWRHNADTAPGMSGMPMVHNGKVFGMHVGCDDKNNSAMSVVSYSPNTMVCCSVLQAVMTNTQLPKNLGGTLNH